MTSSGQEPAAQWIIINGWHTFQHYRDRTPIWVKNYVDLLRRDEYRDLSGHRRAILHGLWLEYATSDGRLRHDTRTLSQRLGLKVTTSDIEALNHAGFVSLADSKPLALRYQAASPDIEKEVDVEKEDSGRPFVARPDANGNGLPEQVIEYDNILDDIQI